MWGSDRKVRPEGYCLTSWGLPSDVRLWSRGRTFLSVPHTHDSFLFLHTFHFWKWVFDNAVTSIVDVRHIVMTIPWRLVASLRSVTSTFIMAYRDVLYNQCISNTWKVSFFVVFFFCFFFFYLSHGTDKGVIIRFASTGVVCGNPHRVCKKFKEFLSQG